MMSAQESSPPVRVAVIGMGFMGRTHLASFSGIPGCRIAAVADRDPDRLTGNPGSGGNIETTGDTPIFDPSEVQVFRTVESLLEGCEFDLGVITTPTPTHVEIALKLVESGRHVLVEKPVSLDLDAMRELDRAAKDGGVMVMPAHCMRFWPAWAWMHERVRDRSFGDIRRASFKRTGAAPDWNPEFYGDITRSGGAIVDLHIHDTDFILYNFGPPAAVSSVGSRSNVRTTYHYEHGPAVEAVGAWLDSPE